MRKECLDVVLEEEERYFQLCREIIAGNVINYEEEYQKYHQKVTEMHQAMQSGDVELYNQLMTISSLEEHYANQLAKNKKVYDKPYFGRIDFQDLEMGTNEKIYIGKCGVMQNKTDLLIADWRAPVSSIYYDNELGRGCYYFYPEDEARERIEIQVDLLLKRNFDISSGILRGYYDSDVASNDELLIQYLSQNKDTVLGEIIATIQKEQNEIIRESPFVNQIVQGVAGSGKTTVAMHRISYILYNYKERFLANEFCIIGGSELLLKYITSGLPELDVYNVKQMKMDGLLIYLLKKEWKKKNVVLPEFADAGYRCRVDFMLSLEEFLEKYRKAAYPADMIRDKEIGVLLTGSKNEALYRENPEFSLKRLLMVMDERVKTRITSLSDLLPYEKVQEKRKEYRSYYKNKQPKDTIFTIYSRFLEDYVKAEGLELSEEHEKALKKGCFDLYDVAALVLIYYRIFQKDKDEEFGQIVIDEAQDFGSGIYYVLRKVLPQCYFTLMGDVSQNVNYETGMNDWEDLKTYFLTGDGDSFKLLLRSYRNTIEISTYAGSILDKASSEGYKIEPVIRHGIPVMEKTFWSEQEMVDYVVDLQQHNQEKQYTTMAVICRDDESAVCVEKELSKYLTVSGMHTENYSEGIMVLPVKLTKGLEFDTVVLWSPQLKQRLKYEKEAKLMYVAATRALHELHVLEN